MMPKSRKQQGFTLFELMVAITAGSLLLGGVLGIFSSSLSASNNSMNLSRLNQDTQAMLELIASDVRRAGSGFDPEVNNSNPFYFNYHSDSCIYYSYDTDGNNALDSNEKFGFQFNSGNNALRYSRTASNCGSGTWEDINDPNIIEITDVVFSLSERCVNLNTNGDCSNTSNGDIGITRNVLDIQISARLTDDTAVTTTAQTSVKVGTGILTEF